MQSGDKTIEIKVTPDTKDTLNIYDCEALLTMALPSKLFINEQTLKLYANRAATTMSTSITLTDPTYNHIKALADNHNVPIDLMINFLIETVCDLSKINTKKITHALDCYYNLAEKAATLTHEINNTTSEKEKLKKSPSNRLFTELLDAYANSVYYDEETGRSK